MLEIDNLVAGVDGKTILNGLSLTVPAGEVHAIMGPNGAGKSTLANVLAGHPAYQVAGGSARLNGKDLLGLTPEARAHEGLFLAFQYPVEIPGVGNSAFLRAAVNAARQARGEPPLDSFALLKVLRDKAKKLGLGDDMLKRAVNAGFSGGEKKRNEVLQMSVLEPRFCVLDETDSGLDIDALKIVAEGVNALRASTRGFLVITHYERLLDYIRPDRVHVQMQGRIVRSGDATLAATLEAEGYQPLRREEA
jgi:Fe-S cluster assembly ATP-binding protein